MGELAILFHVFSVPYSYNCKHGDGKRRGENPG